MIFLKIRQLRAQETRAKIVAAAEELISERGFDAVQIIDITNEAGVGKGSFYTYFKRKEDVAAEIAHARFEDIHEDSEQQVGDVCERLTTFLTGSVAYVKEAGIRIAQQWVRGVVEPGNQDGVNKLAYDRDVIHGLIEKAIQNGELDHNAPIEKLSDWIATQYYGIVFCWALKDGENDPTGEMSDFCQGMLRDYLNPYIIR